VFTAWYELGFLSIKKSALRLEKFKRQYLVNVRFKMIKVLAYNSLIIVCG
jgi:hypothetical protein